jgi:hypothetical protein
MVGPKLVIATVLAGVAFALALFGMIGKSSIVGMQAGHASLAASHIAGLSGSHVPGLIALASSVTAFIVSWTKRSYLIASLLIGAGIFYAIHLSPFLGDHSGLAIIGPVTGLFFGHVILALGVAKGIGSAKTKLVQSPKKSTNPELVTDLLNI